MSTKIKSSFQLIVDSQLNLGDFGATTSQTPTNSNDVVNKAYVDGVVQGLDVKASVKAASTTTVNIANPNITAIDGVTLSENDRVLLKDQAAPAENGIYLWRGQNGTMLRASDMDSWEELPGAFTYVEQGTANAGKGFVCIAQSGVLGTSAINFSQFSGIGSYAPLSHVGSHGTSEHAVVDGSNAGFMSVADKSKLDGIAANANNYSHPTGDGNLHVPATGTTNEGKYLRAGSSAGSLSWSSPDWSEIANKPSTFAPSAHDHNSLYSTYAFSNINVSGETAIAASSLNDTLTIAKGNGINLSTNDKTLTIAAVVNTDTMQNNVNGIGVKNGGIGSLQLASDAVGTSNIADSAVAFSKLAADASMKRDRFVPTAGQTVFTLTNNAVSNATTYVYVNGILQDGAGVDYTQSNATATNKTISFTTGLTTTDVVQVLYY